MSGRLVKINIDGTVETHPSKKADYESLKTLVGGYIERIRVRYEGKIRDAYVDEDGLGKGLLPNRTIMGMLDGVFKNYPSVIVGPAVIWVPDPKKKVAS